MVDAAVNDIKALIDADASIVEERLRKAFKSSDNDMKKLVDSVNYSLLSGGKRIRPFLTLEFSRAFHGNSEAALDFAAAIECVHTYSLIHDDLPGMDNDTLRRGKPTNHIVFGEATAILAGDALLTEAFGIISGAKCDPETKVRAISILSAAAGIGGMVGGQQIDLESENKKIPYEKLLKMHLLKTGALIKAACLLGLATSEFSNDKAAIKAVGDYAEGIGTAFQIIDDIFDETKSPKETGKSSSDKENGKNTFLGFMSVPEAYAKAEELTEEACKSISEYDSEKVLACAARYLCGRSN